MSIHGCHEKTRASPACLYLTIQEYWHLPGVAVEFVRKLLPWQCLGDSNPAGLFACWASDTFMRKCFGRVPTGDFPPKLKSLGTEEVCTVYVHGICFWFCLFVCMVFLKTISWWKVASASDFFENVKEFIIYLT